MNCNRAQELFDDLARERLDAPAARQVREHLTDCSDCRVAQQRVARLQRLLALKRYEQPPAQCMDNVVAEFHRRLAAEVQRGSAWDRLVAALGFDSFGPLRYGWAGACAVVLVAGLAWIGLRNSADALHEAQLALPNPLVIVERPQFPSFIEPRDGLAAKPTPFEGAAVELVAAGRAQPSPPRYVLDRIAITPASYEPASIDF